MSNLQVYCISKEMRSEKAIAMLEVAMLSVIVLSLFTAAIAMTERVSLYSYTNQLLEDELQSQRRSFTLASSSRYQTNINQQIRDSNQAIVAQLQLRGIESSDYQLETALVEVNSASSRASTLSLDQAGASLLTSFNAPAIVEQYYASVSEDSEVFNSNLETSFLSEQINSNNLSTKLIISRLLIKQDRNIFRFLKYAGLENQVLVQKIIPLRLDYRL